MKRIIMIVLILLVLFTVYVIFNRFDAKAAQLAVQEQWDMPVHVVQLTELFKPASFDKSNGYYRLWTLTEPPGADIESEATIYKYRKLHDPQYDTEKYTKEWMESGNDWKATGKERADQYRRGSYQQYCAEKERILGKDPAWINFPEKVIADWCLELKEKRNSVLQLKAAYGVLLERYQKMIDCEQFEEFTQVIKNSDIFADAAIPNLLAWLDVGKLYVVVNMLDAVDGKWHQGTANLLEHIRFTKKSIKNSRTLIVNLIGKALTRISLHGLISIMNQKDCPKEIFQQVLDGLPPLEQEEFCNSKQLLTEAFLLAQQVKKQGGLFYQVNRTQQYYFDFMAKLYLADKTPPYLWKAYPLTNSKVKTGWFWWLQNPGGKSEFQKFLDKKTQKFLDNKTGEFFFVVSFGSCAVKVFYDLTRISAELHLRYQPGKPVQETLNGLEIYRSLKDPCSGKSYIWNDKKQLLYGIGFDKKDNGGGDSTRYTQIEGVDFAFPVILF